MRTVEEILAAMQAIVDGAQGRALTAEECDKYEACERELTERRRHDAIAARHAAYNAPVTDPIKAVAGDDAGAKALAAAFQVYLRTGHAPDDLSSFKATGQKEGTGSEGGYLVPPGFRDKLVDRMKAFGGIASIAEEINTTSGNELPWPTVDDTANTGEIVAEGGTFAGGADLVFDTASLSAYRYMAGGGGATPLRVSVDLAQDSAFDIESFVARKLGQRIARIQATHLATGTGVKQPLGLIYGLTGVEPADDTKGITYDDLLTFVHSVDPEYRGNARWVFNDTSLMTIEKIKDSNGDPLWRSIQATMGDAASSGRLLNFPITIDQAMPDIDIDNKTINWGAFGDIREGYVVRRVRQVVVVVNPWSRAAYGEIEYTAWARFDATQQNTNAYVALCGEAP